MVSLAKAPSPALNVLIIEDNPTYASVLKKRLSQTSSPSFNIRHADKLEDALPLLSGELDVVLLDLTLPDSHGLESLSALRQKAPEVPIVVLTCVDDKVLGLEAVRKGAQDYLVKGRIKASEISQVLCYAIERQHKQQELKNVSLIDELTGLQNRRGFLILAEQQLKLAFRLKKYAALVFIDLDGLKNINDEHGHPEGDQALQETSRILKRTFRDSDILARLGGDEFAVLTTLDSEGSTALILERLEESARTSSYSYRFKLSFSYGVAFFDCENPCSLEDLIAEADRIMYRNKRKNKADAEEEIIKKSAPDEIPPAEAAALSSGKKKILIVEDDDSIRKFLSYRLKRMAFEVFAADNGEDGLAEARQKRPDLILLDLRLPKLSGEEVCKAIREDSDKSFAKTPILMLTAKNSDVDRVIGKVIGADSYLTKPFVAKDLLAEIRSLLRLSQKGLRRRDE